MQEKRIPIQSQTDPAVWYVVRDRDGFVTCTCRGFEQYSRCKHAIAYVAVRDYAGLPAQEAIKKARRQSQ